MRNIFFKISYKGTNYHGSQFQKNAVSVMDTFQTAVKKIIKNVDFQLKACSRTDAGVHANAFCISMITDCNIACEALKKGLNSALPCDISVLECKEASQDFHARYSCTGKKYIYKIWNSDVKNPFLGDLAYQYKYTIDEKMLNKQAKDFIGTYDFKAFSGSKCELEDTVRTIYDCSVIRDGNMIIISVKGDGFLYNMVRIIVGTLIAISAGLREKDSIKTIILSKDRKRAGATAPACGLYLDEVYYNEEV